MYKRQVNDSPEKLEEFIKMITNGDGFDATVEAVGAPVSYTHLDPRQAVCARRGGCAKAHFTDTPCQLKGDLEND